MTLTTILNNGVTGLTAQSYALNVLSDNIANASTNGYRASDANFSALVTDGGADATGAGVRASSRLLADKSGTIGQTGIGTNAAIGGSGFFAVAAVDSLTGQVSSIGTGTGTNVELTRSGDFQQDRFGHLVNGAGLALMGIPVDPAGSGGSGTSGRSLSDLQLVSLDRANAYFSPTSSVSLSATLPGALPAGQSPTSDNTVGATLSVIDGTGKTGSVALRLMKTGDGADGSSSWAVYRAGATNGDGSTAGDGRSDDPSTWQPLGTIGFDATGTLTGGTAGAQATLAIPATGSLPALTLDLGTYGQTGSGLTVATGSTTTDLTATDLTIDNLSQSDNGIAAGSLQSVDLTADGFVRGTFAGGKTRDFYRIPDATVANPADLAEQSGAAFTATKQSGDIVLKDFGSGSGAGATLTTGAVEGSNVSVEDQFTTLITAQRAYSASSKIVSTADEMTQTALGLMN